MTPEALTETGPTYSRFRWFRCSNCERCTVTMLCGCPAPAPAEMFTKESYDSLAAQLRAAETALQQYADPRHWGISRDEFKHPRVAWIGPGATDTVPDPAAIARAYLEGQQG